VVQLTGRPLADWTAWGATQAGMSVAAHRRRRDLSCSIVENRKKALRSYAKRFDDVIWSGKRTSDDHEISAGTVRSWSSTSVAKRC
jgi:hypothetical protein